MTLSWATYSVVKDSSVWIGNTKDSLKLTPAPVAQVSYYHDNSYTMIHNHVLLSGLKPSTKYFYKVGSKSNAEYTSEIYSFVTARSGSDSGTFNIVVYGDLGPGNQSKNTIDYLNTLTSENIDLIYHVGGVGYADDDFEMPGQYKGFWYEKVYNGWMNSMAPVMSSIPYMIVVGNHDAECRSESCGESKEKMAMLGNYSAFNTRFKMPSAEVGGALNMWYSFEHGPIHFTSVSTETDYPDAPKNGATKFSKNGNFGDQLKWMEADLKKAAANRANVPWIIVGMHRPVYDLFGSVQLQDNMYVVAAFEDLLVKYEVDVVVTAHQHYYERQSPIRNNTAILEGVSSDFKTYTNPKAPVYIVSGAAGTVDGLSNIPEGNATWNVASNYVDYGFSTLEANQSMLSWKFVKSSSQAVLDEFVMWKTT
ncbi:Iron/zinc purple acid phosphatase [Phytophthora megakarya]|uniref:Purple acid phosphatase n=1 Tax=Phytophthora megakarya TaxID=4795 RepID=A0A225W288_9STRA|nr:Iron/zinc purple acid phosphatase [Phytophthora megakarya]